MKPRLLVGIGGIILLLGLALGAFLYWRQAAAQAATNRAFTTAEKLAGNGRWAEARAVLEDQTRKHGRTEDPGLLTRWRTLEFRLAGGLKDFAAIEAIAAAHPELIATDENAALWLWRLRRAAKDEKSAAAVRAVWQGRGTDAVGWLCAEVDGLVNSGQREEAKKLLAGSTLTGPTAVPLELRRALLASTPVELIGAFDQAYRLDPTNADLRSLRAAALEAAGQPAYARVDFVAALVADQKNPLRRDDLASFYLRQGDVADAVMTWREGLSPASPDFLWERALFWGRVLGVADPEVALVGASRRERFAGWLATIPSARYWDETGYAALNLPASHAQREPAVTWLRVLEHLRNSEFDQALTILRQAPVVAVTAAPALHAALRLTLAVRAGAQPIDTGIAWPVTRGTGHRWWDVLGSAVKGDRAASAELVAVAGGPNVVAATLLAAGWTGPACALTNWTAAAKADTPVWVQFGLLQARRQVQGPAAALAWAETLPAVPETDLVRAELQLAGGRVKQAVATLQLLAVRPDDIGYAAGWTLATWQLEQGLTSEAETTVTRAPRLRDVPLGIELLARCALAGGRPAEAQKLYTSIQQESLAAGAYLARQAYIRHDWAEARRITAYWLSRLPDNLELRANLEAIAAAERAGGGA